MSSPVHSVISRILFSSFHLSNCMIFSATAVQDSLPPVSHQLARLGIHSYRVQFVRIPDLFVYLIKKIYQNSSTGSGIGVESSLHSPPMPRSSGATSATSLSHSATGSGTWWSTTALAGSQPSPAPLVERPTPGSRAYRITSAKGQY